MREEYFLDKTLWGDGQLSLKDVIDRIIVEMKDDDSFIRNAERGHLILLAKKALKELGFITSYGAKGVKFNVPMSLSVPVEEDFADLIRVSVIQDCKLYRIKENTNGNYEVKSYLQDCSGDLIFDCEGQVYDSDCRDNCSHNKPACECEECDKCCVDNSDKYKDSTVQIINGAMVFSHDIEDKEVFVEYMSNGLVNELNECDIRLKQIFEEAIIYFVYWKYLEKRVNTQNRASYYRELYLLEYRRIRRNEGLANVTGKTISNMISKYR